MNRFAYIGMLSVFGTGLALLIVDARKPAQALQAYEPLEGTIFTGDISVFRHASLDLAQDGAMQTVGLAFDDLTLLGLDAKTQHFLVDVVDSTAAKWTF